MAVSGERGERGDQGQQGAAGERGDSGQRGVAGERGAKGDHGQHGERGATGVRGATNRYGVIGYLLLAVSTVFAVYYTNASADYATCISRNATRQAVLDLVDNIAAYGIVTPERQAELNIIRATAAPLKCHPPLFR